MNKKKKQVRFSGEQSLYVYEYSETPREDLYYTRLDDVVSSDDEPPEQAARRKPTATKETPTRNLLSSKRFTNQILPVDRCNVSDYMTFGCLVFVSKNCSWLIRTTI